MTPLLYSQEYILPPLSGSIELDILDSYQANRQEKKTKSLHATNFCKCAQACVIDPIIEGKDSPMRIHRHPACM